MDMKWIKSLSIAVLLALQCQATVQTQAATLDELKAKYEASIQQVVKDGERQKLEAVSNYGAGLETLVKTLKLKGDLDNYLQAETEKKRFDKNRTVPSDSSVDGISRLITAYKDRNWTIDADCLKKATVQQRLYISQIDALIKGLMQADKMEEARDAKAERDRVSTIIARNEASKSRTSMSSGILLKLAASPNDKGLIRQLGTEWYTATNRPDRSMIGTVYCLVSLAEGNPRECLRIRSEVARAFPAAGAELTAMLRDQASDKCLQCKDGSLKDQCNMCGGKGVCQQCKGTGKKQVPSLFRKGEMESFPCGSCSGSTRCGTCKGKGILEKQCTACDKGYILSPVKAKDVYLSLLTRAAGKATEPTQKDTPRDTPAD